MNAKKRLFKIPSSTLHS